MSVSPLEDKGRAVRKVRREGVTGQGEKRFGGIPRMRENNRLTFIRQFEPWHVILHMLAVDSSC